ncbi:MAG: alpha/beta fold hydrolase [Patescibacteria group bacterium]
MNPTILILPGWQDSGPEHWQSLWLAKFPNAVKVEQADWMNPKKDDWVATLNDYVSRYDEVVLVAHSLGCPLVAHWAKEHPENTARVKGALLVAPGDADAPDFPQDMQGFSPVPLKPLRFKSILVTSDNDKWVSLERAQHFANAWNSQFINIGAQGHINTAAGMGDWPEGERLVEELLGE